MTATSPSRNVLILRNPKSGASDTRERVETLANSLKKKGFSAEIFTDLDQATSQANELYSAGDLYALVGVGGDGTAAELVNRTSPGLPLTLLPGGNENLLARHLHLAFEPEKLAETIARGKISRLDAGRAGSRIFLLMASCGLDAEVVRTVHQRRTGHISSRDYLKPVWNALRSYDYPELRVYCDEKETTDGSTDYLSLRWLAAFNLPCYGGGLKLMPNADGSDGQLDLCGLRRGSAVGSLALMAAAFFGQQRRLGDWTARKIRRLRIESDSPVPYQLDGDPGGVLPLTIEVLPQRLTMIVP
jgi:diacylglycerol kinase family enzyme